MGLLAELGEFTGSSSEIYEQDYLQISIPDKLCYSRHSVPDILSSDSALLDLASVHIQRLVIYLIL